MLRAKMSNGMFVLGLDVENVRRLKNGEPIMVCLSEMGGKDDVMIMYGDTLDDIKRELEQSTGSELPPAKPIEELRNVQ